MNLTPSDILGASAVNLLNFKQSLKEKSEQKKQEVAQK